MSSNWAFYNAVRAWVAQHPPKPPADVEPKTGTDPPDTKR